MCSNICWTCVTSSNYTWAGCSEHSEEKSQHSTVNWWCLFETNHLDWKKKNYISGRSNTIHYWCIKTLNLTRKHQLFLLPLVDGCFKTRPTFLHLFWHFTHYSQAWKIPVYCILFWSAGWYRKPFKLTCKCLLCNDHLKAFWNNFKDFMLAWHLNSE